MTRVRRSWLVALGGLVLIAAGAVPATLAGFSATTSNAGSTFEAASSFSGATVRMATGFYPGNATDDRAIAGLGFQPDLVIVKGNANQVAVVRTSTMSGDQSKPLAGASGLMANVVQSLGADGFTVGTNAQVNAAGTTYHWMAVKASSGALKLGSYTGTAIGQAIAGTGFAPEYVAVLGATNQRAVQRYSGMTGSYRFDADSGLGTRITSLDADGFSIGTSAEVNSALTTYHYVAFNDLPGAIRVGSYPGTGGSPLNVTGVGFRPEYLAVRANANRRGHHRPDGLWGDSSLYYEATANAAGRILALQSDGFKVGADAAVNTSGETVHYLALRNSAGGCSTPYVAASADAWVDENPPGIPSGGPVTTFKVRSASGRNRRALIKFDLPTAPSGCTLTSAKLHLHNGSPESIRTLEALRANAAWTEGTVTWAGQPATTGPAASATTPAAPGWMQWSVTSQVQSMYAYGNHGFLIRDQTESDPGDYEQPFESREGGSFIPYLELTFG